MPPPELAEQGVYCEGCHTIEADWQRAKAEVMPPAVEHRSRVEGARFRRVRRSEPCAASRPPPAPPALLRQRRHASRQNRKPSGKPPRACRKSAAAADTAGETPLRVPFGRGPKDKAFRGTAGSRKRDEHKSAGGAD